MRIANCRFLPMAIGISNFSAFLILLFSLPFAANAQKINLNCAWTNGDVTIYPDKLNDTVVYFFAGNLHEGWIDFCLNLKKLDSLGLYDGGDTCSSQFIESLKLKVVNGVQILFVKREYSGMTIYRQGYPNESLFDLIISTKTNHELAGKYINPATGKTVIFYPDKQSASGLTKSTEYVFEDYYDRPAEIITFDNKQTFSYATTEKGLDIFAAKKEDESSDWSRGKKLMSLVKTQWLNTDSLKNTPGKYPFASKEILIEAILSCYSSAKLALMRNEIYARHGLIFKSESLKKYFSSQSWYKPLFENVEGQLSELEKFNIEQIKRYEIIAIEEEKEREDEKQ